MKIKSRSNEAMTEFTENLRMAFGDERDKKSELHSDGELILVVYGVNEETAGRDADTFRRFRSNYTVMLSPQWESRSEFNGVVHSV